MEQEVAEKLALVQQLQAQQQALLHKQAALGNSLGAQQALTAQLEALRVSVGPPQAARQAVYADAAEVEQLTAAVLLGREGCKTTNPPDAEAQGAAAANAGEAAGGQQQQQPEASDVLRRYKQYVVEASASLAAAAAPSKFQQQQQQQQEGSTAAADSFPAFPFNLVEALSLWKISQSVGVPDIDDAAELAACGSSNSAGSSAAAAGSEAETSIKAGTVNLQSFLHDVVPLLKWVQVAQQLSVQPWQREQLKAAWQLYTSAIQKLNLERQQLVQQLQEKLEDGSTAAAAAAAGGQRTRTAAAAGLTGAAARIRPSPQGAVGAQNSSSGAGCICSPLSGSDLQGYLDLANAVEWNLVRGRAMVMLFGWAMLCVLGREQIARLCVASWPHFPLMRAVAGVLVAGTDQEQDADG
jgi:hypothetical protein